METRETSKKSRKSLVLAAIIVVVALLLLVAFMSGLFSSSTNNGIGGGTSSGQFSLASYSFGNNGHTMVSVTLEDKGTTAATVVGIAFDGKSLVQGTQCSYSWDSELGDYRVTPQGDLTLFVCPSSRTQVPSGQHSIEFTFDTGNSFTTTIGL